MAKVITLDGLPSISLDGNHRECVSPITVYSPTLERDVTFCGEDFKQSGGGFPRRRGRPRGTTVAKGAKAPKFAMCKKKSVRTLANGRRVCQCTDAGNRQFLPLNRCKSEED